MLDHIREEIWLLPPTKPEKLKLHLNSYESFSRIVLQLLTTCRQSLPQQLIPLLGGSLPEQLDLVHHRPQAPGLYMTTLVTV